MRTLSLSLSLFCCSVIHSDGAYHIIIDQQPFLKGNLLEDMTPPILSEKEIDDPDDKMPEDWDEREKYTLATFHSNTLNFQSPFQDPRSNCLQT